MDTQACINQEKQHIDRALFRAYDIRGNIQRLTASVVLEIGYAFGKQLVQKGGTRVVIARDGRLSSPVLQAALQTGLQRAGVDVLEAGQLPSPVLYFAAERFAEGSGIMVTGSHNPPEDNGLKMMCLGETLAGDAIEALYHQCVLQEAKNHSVRGTVQSLSVLPLYQREALATLAVKRSVKVVVDGGHGVGGPVLVALLEALGAHVIPLYCTVDGRFPAHHPDPSCPANLHDLQAAVVKHGAEVGLALDGDGDRLGVVDNQGTIVWPDQLMLLFVEKVLEHTPGATILYDVKCTQQLEERIRALGGVPMLCRTGHSFVKAALKETQAAFAGEMSGHLFFKDRWNGFDDAAYAACRLVEWLSQSDMTLSTWYSALKPMIATPELRVAMQEGESFTLVAQFIAKAHFKDARYITIDGLRIETQEGWALVRASNTTPFLILRFEATTEQALVALQQAVKAQLLAIKSDLCFSF